MNDIKAMNNNMIEEGRMYLMQKTTRLVFIGMKAMCFEMSSDVICPPVQNLTEIMILWC